MQSSFVSIVPITSSEYIDKEYIDKVEYYDSEPSTTIDFSRFYKVNTKYNKWIYNMQNFSFVFLLKEDQEVCMKLFESIKENQSLLIQYNCEMITFQHKVYVVPPKNKEITLETDIGKVNFTMLADKKGHVFALRLSEPYIHIPYFNKWNVIEVVSILFFS